MRVCTRCHSAININYLPLSEVQLQVVTISSAASTMYIFPWNALHLWKTKIYKWKQNLPWWILECADYEIIMSLPCPGVLSFNTVVLLNDEVLKNAKTFILKKKSMHIFMRVITWLVANHCHPFIMWTKLRVEKDDHFQVHVPGWEFPGQSHHWNGKSLNRSLLRE